MGGSIMEYELVLGLETHVELSTRTKIFCGCPVRFGREPNSDCCPVCIGMPGTLPVLNREVVHYAALAGMALQCKINPVSRMSRKHYFYPDLAKAYQITQHEVPLCEHGQLTLSDGRTIHIQRIHIEEDAGKLIHNDSEILVDYNRGGVPLIEIVTSPDFRTARQAAEYLEELQAIMRYLGISDCKMQEGSLRVDVNVSVRPKGQEALGVRTEIKNMNSMTYLIRAVEYECRRQIEILESGGKIHRETRRYDQRTGETLPMRQKEAENDYRYFEEPDIPPVVISEQEIAAWRQELPELPAQKRRRYQTDWGLSEQDACSLTKYPAVADFFEKTCQVARQPGRVAKWILSQVFASLPNEEAKQKFELMLTPQEFGSFLLVEEQGELSHAMAKEALSDLLCGKSLKQALLGRRGSAIEEEELEILCQKAIRQNPTAVEDYQRGKNQAAKALLGAVMKASGGRADPKDAQRRILQQLQER